MVRPPDPTGGRIPLTPPSLPSVSTVGVPDADLPRERGWRRLLPAILLLLVVPAVPYLQMLAPIQETLLLLVTCMAVCTLLGWRNGGRLAFAVIWTALAVYLLWRPVSVVAAYDAVARSWALILAASFGVVSLVVPRARFFSRALSSIALAFAIVWGVLLLRPNGIQSFGDTWQRELYRRGEAALASWERDRTDPAWQRMETETPAVRTMSAEVSRIYREMPRVTSQVATALLAVESLVVLSLAWGLYHRVSRARIGGPLSPLRQFRFNDQLIWGLVLGVTLVALPTLSALRGVGFNLLLFFGVLYALRGLGVLTWFLAPRRLAFALLIVIAVISWPVVGLFSLGLGLGDTWLDWRGRARPTS